MIFKKKTKFNSTNPTEGMWQDMINEEFMKIGIRCKRSNSELFINSKEKRKQLIKACHYDQFQGKSFQIKMVENHEITSFVIISMNLSKKDEKKDADKIKTQRIYDNDIPEENVRIIQILDFHGFKMVSSNHEGQEFSHEIKKELALAN